MDHLKDQRTLLSRTAELALEYLRSLPERRVGATATTRDVIARVQADGTCWLGGTVWHGLAAMRISVSNWSTEEGDVDASVAAILRAYGAVG